MTEKETFALAKFNALTAIFPTETDADVDAALIADIKARLKEWNDALRAVASDAAADLEKGRMPAASDDFYKAITENLHPSLRLGLLAGFGLYILRCF